MEEDALKQMSSESSDVERMDDGTERAVMVVKQLPWRGGKATRFMKRLDSKATSKKSMQSVQQTLPRVIGSNSTRPKPHTCLLISGYLLLSNWYNYYTASLDDRLVHDCLIYELCNMSFCEALTIVG